MNFGTTLGKTIWSKGRAWAQRHSFLVMPGCVSVLQQENSGHSVEYYQRMIQWHTDSKV